MQRQFGEGSVRDRPTAHGHHRELRTGQSGQRQGGVPPASQDGGRTGQQRQHQQDQPGSRREVPGGGRRRRGGEQYEPGRHDDEHRDLGKADPPPKRHDADDGRQPDGAGRAGLDQVERK
ncbi:MAG: hypothetical protein LC635_02905 [Pseudonocardiaceae bacterium]|nr:hypothetical protein [Pseudonocardiaceae bacterium]